MDFGSLTKEEINQRSFSLPPDPAETKKILAIAAQNNTEFFVGQSMWGSKRWVGTLYPPGTKEQNLLTEYSKQFSAIEFNATGYSLPAAEQIKPWPSKVGNGFLFCPKFTNLLTHVKKLQNIDKDLATYLDVISQFGKNLGPIFMIVHPQMSPSDLLIIEEFILKVPDHIKMFIEVRHPDWFKAGGLNPALFQFLQNIKRGTVITDTVGRRDCVHMHLSTSECFIRFVGNDLHPTDYSRIDEWADRIASWVAQGLQKCYFFIQQSSQGLEGPKLAAYLIDKLNSNNNLNIKAPSFQPDNRLF